MKSLKLSKMILLTAMNAGLLYCIETINSIKDHYNVSTNIVNTEKLSCVQIIHCYKSDVSINNFLFKLRYSSIYSHINIIKYSHYRWISAA